MSIPLLVLTACGPMSGPSKLRIARLGPIEASSDSGKVPALVVLPSKGSRPPVLAIAMKNASRPGCSIRVVELDPSGERTRDVQFPEWAGVGPGICAGPDVDGDGTPDLVLRVLRASASSLFPIGGIALVSSSTGAVRYEVSEGSPGLFGYDLALVGDRDGDGVEDVAVGHPESVNFGPKADSSGRIVSAGSIHDMPKHADGCRVEWGGSSSGRVHIVSGATGASIRTIEAPEGAFGFGSAVERIADIDGDSTMDLAVGAAFACAERCGEGRVLICSARTDELVGELGGGLELPEFAAFGMSIASAPDRAGELAYDVVVGAPESERAYLMSLRRPARSIPLHLAVTERDEFDWRFEALGAAVAACCDVDGDRIDDWALLAPARYGVPAHRGALYVLSGSNGGFLALAEGSDSLRIVGMACGAGATGAEPFGAWICASERYESFDVSVGRPRPRTP